MEKIEWDKTGERKYQLGVSNVALYRGCQDNRGRVRADSQ